MPAGSDSTKNSPVEVADQDIAAMLENAIESEKEESSGSERRFWEPPSVDEISPFLPDFQIISLVGRGGMGAVYKAIQMSLQRTVAIKVLPPELNSNPEFEVRFRREAHAMAKLNHPNIVQIYDFGQTDGGHLYFVMEYVEGSDLRESIRNGSLDREAALLAVNRICEALQYAHSKGFVHRDIKPGNIFVDEEGDIKVGDFGLAKLIDESESHGESAIALTMTGFTMGSPNYIAPEQLEAGGEIDHRADIYSLGVMIHEMLTGEIPTSKCDDLLSETDPLLRNTVFKATDADPNQRFQSAADLQSELEEIRSHRKPSNHIAVYSGLLLLILLFAGGIIFFNQPSPDNEKVDQNIPVRNLRPAFKFPIPDPTELPSVPTTQCRLVVLKNPNSENSFPDAIFENIANADFCDYVKLGERSLNFNILAIRSGGRPVLWKGDGTVVMPDAKDAVAAYGMSFPADIVWVDSSGDIHGANTDPSMQNRFNTMKDIVHFRMMNDNLFAISGDGQRHIIGDPVEVHFDMYGIALENVADISLGMKRNYRIIFKDGSLQQISFGKSRSLKSPGSISRIIAHNLLQKPDHTFLALDAFTAFGTEVKDVDRIYQASNHTKSCAAQFEENGPWRIWLKDEIWRRNKKIEQAVGHAIDVRIQTNSYICALLPADSVPRSGLWDIDELIEIQKQGQKFEVSLSPPESAPGESAESRTK